MTPIGACETTQIKSGKCIKPKLPAYGRLRMPAQTQKEKGNRGANTT